MLGGVKNKLLGRGAKGPSPLEEALCSRYESAWDKVSRGDISTQEDIKLIGCFLSFPPSSPSFPPPPLSPPPSLPLPLPGKQWCSDSQEEERRCGEECSGHWSGGRG